MNREYWVIISVVLVALSVVVNVVAQAHLIPLYNDQPSIESVSENPDPYLGHTITITGWYQGGTVRDEDPICANTQGGLQLYPYNYIFIDVPHNASLAIGQKYVFTGTLKADILGRSVPESRPIFVPDTIHAANGTNDCTLFSSGENMSTTTMAPLG